MNVPFYENTDDNLHCFQAAVKMVLKYFLPDKDFSWTELERLSDKLPKMATWPQRMLINLKEMGFETTLVEDFDYEAFILDGADYLTKAFGSKVADWQISHSDIAMEQQTYREAVNAGVDLQKRQPDFNELRQLLDKGYLIVSTVNSRKLNDREGYVGHSIVIFKADEQGVTFHDPGPPGLANRSISRKAFIAAWADPNATAQNYIALKLKVAV